MIPTIVWWLIALLLLIPKWQILSIRDLCDSKQIFFFVKFYTQWRLRVITSCDLYLWWRRNTHICVLVISYIVICIMSCFLFLEFCKAKPKFSFIFVILIIGVFPWRKCIFTIIISLRLLDLFIFWIGVPNSFMLKYLWIQPWYSPSLFSRRYQLELLELTTVPLPIQYRFSSIIRAGCPRCQFGIPLPRAWARP